jgi:hypothetical protein
MLRKPMDVHPKRNCDLVVLEVKIPGHPIVHDADALDCPVMV